ncbi:hypothetical protein D9M71_374400 [compost metagenome]
MGGTCNAEILRQAAKGELSQLIVIRQLAAGLAQQLIDRHVAAGHAEQIAIQVQAAIRDLAEAGDFSDVDAADMAHAFFMQRFKHRAVQMTGDSALFQRDQQRAISGIGTHVHQRCNLNTLLVQIERCVVTVVVPREYHCAFARLYGVEFHQALGCAAKHHPGQIVVAENHWLIKRAAGDQALGGAHLVHAFTLNHRQIVIGEPCIARSFLQHLNVGVAFNSVDQLAA